MITKLQISPIHEVDNAIQFLAPFHHQEWRHLNPKDYSIAQRVNDYKKATSQHKLPLMLVAHQDSECFGSVRLIDNDLSSHPELSPWLASLYVLKEYRYQKISSQLIDALISQAKSLGVKLIYLYTEHQSDYYQKRGWKVLTKEIHQEKPITIMYYKINPS